MKNNKQRTLNIIAAILLTSLVGFITLVAIDGVSFTQNGQLQSIENKLFDGDIESAEAEIQDFIEENPDNALGWQLYGNIMLERGEIFEAQQYYLEALDLDDQLDKSYVGLGAIARIDGENEIAIQNYEQALEINNDNAEAYSSLSVVYIELEEYELALENALKAYELEDRNPVIAANLSLAYHYNANFVYRQDFYDRAIELGYQNGEELQLLFEDNIFEDDLIESLNN